MFYIQSNLVPAGSKEGFFLNTGGRVNWMKFIHAQEYKTKQSAIGAAKRLLANGKTRGSMLRIVDGNTLDTIVCVGKTGAISID